MGSAAKQPIARIFAFAVALAASAAIICQLPQTAKSAPASCPPPASAPAESEQPASGPAPPAQEVVIACVGTQAITEAAFLHWHEIATVREPGSRERPTAEAAIVEAMGFLISGDWVLGEAQALGVHVTAAAVHRQFESLRKLQFPRQSDFQAFLKQTRQTVADLLLRVELDMLSARIRKRVTSGYHRPAGKMRALARFAAHFRKKWTANTYCAPQYAVHDCGHIRSNL